MALQLFPNIPIIEQVTTWVIQCTNWVETQFLSFQHSFLEISLKNASSSHNWIDNSISFVMYTCHHIHIHVLMMIDLTCMFRTLNAQCAWKYWTIRCCYRAIIDFVGVAYHRVHWSYKHVLCAERLRFWTPIIFLWIGFSLDSFRNTFQVMHLSIHRVFTEQLCRE